jgi:hypothetical protein
VWYSRDPAEQMNGNPVTGCAPALNTLVGFGEISLGAPPGIAPPTATACDLPP